MADVAETIEESGRRIGRHAWVEARLFEIVGSWAGTVAEPRSRALFARQSAHHAWHVELWHGLLPALPHLADNQLVGPDGTDAEMVASLAAFDDRSGTAGTAEIGDVGVAAGTADTGDAKVAAGTGDAGVEPGGPEGSAPAGAADRLVALYRRVLPARLAAYDDHLAHTSPVADGPTMRVLRLVRTDLAEDILAGEALIEALGPPPGPSA